jgi:hypothetical protein
MTYEYIEPRWNDTDRRKPENSEKNLSQCYFVHHKFHVEWPGLEPGPATDRLNHGMAINPLNWKVAKLSYLIDFVAQSNIIFCAGLEIDLKFQLIYR